MSYVDFDARLRSEFELLGYRLNSCHDHRSGFKIILGVKKYQVEMVVDRQYPKKCPGYVRIRCPGMDCKTVYDSIVFAFGAPGKDLWRSVSIDTTMWSSQYTLELFALEIEEAYRKK